MADTMSPDWSESIHHVYETYKSWRTILTEENLANDEELNQIASQLTLSSFVHHNTYTLGCHLEETNIELEAALPEINKKLEDGFEKIWQAMPE